MITTCNLWKRDGLLTLAIAIVIIIGGVCPNNHLIIFANMFNIESSSLTNYSHFILFFILGVVSIRQLYARLSVHATDFLFPSYSFPVFWGLVFFACLTESLQFFTFDRTPKFIDLFAEDDGTVKIYWGGADSVMCVGVAKIDDLVDLCLKKSRPPLHQ